MLVNLIYNQDSACRKGIRELLSAIPSTFSVSQAAVKHQLSLLSRNIVHILCTLMSHASPLVANGSRNSKKWVDESSTVESDIKFEYGDLSSIDRAVNDLLGVWMDAITNIASVWGGQGLEHDNIYIPCKTDFDVECYKCLFQPLFELFFHISTKQNFGFAFESFLSSHQTRVQDTIVSSFQIMLPRFPTFKYFILEQCFLEKYCLYSRSIVDTKKCAVLILALLDGIRVQTNLDTSQMELENFLDVLEQQYNMVQRIVDTILVNESKHHAKPSDCSASGCCEQSFRSQFRLLAFFLRNSRSTIVLDTKALCKLWQKLFLTRLSSILDVKTNVSSKTASLQPTAPILVSLLHTFTIQLCNSIRKTQYTTENASKSMCTVRSLSQLFTVLCNHQPFVAYSPQSGFECFKRIFLFLNSKYGRNAVTKSSASLGEKEIDFQNSDSQHKIWGFKTLWSFVLINQDSVTSERAFAFIKKLCTSQAVNEMLVHNDNNDQCTLEDTRQLNRAQNKCYIFTPALFEEHCLVYCHNLMTSFIEKVFSGPNQTKVMKNKNAMPSKLTEILTYKTNRQDLVAATAAQMFNQLSKDKLSIPVYISKLKNTRLHEAFCASLNNRFQWMNKQQKSFEQYRQQRPDICYLEKALFVLNFTDKSIASMMEVEQINSNGNEHMGECFALLHNKSIIHHKRAKQSI